MPFNGSGTFTRNYSWVNDANNGIDIDATRMDTDTNDITGNGLSNCITRDGQSVPTANLPMGNFRHTGVASGTARTQYASIAQLQDGGTLFGGTSSGTNTITFNLTPAITAYVAGQEYSFIAGNACTGPATLNINGVGAVALTKFGSTALIANDILAGGIYVAGYDGTEFQLLNPTPSAFPTASTILDTIGSTQGDLLYRNSSAWNVLAPGASGTILKSQGAAANPAWETVAAGLETIGSTQGQIMYRNSTAWVPLAVGTSGQFLQTQGSAANPQWATPATAFSMNIQKFTSNGTYTPTVGMVYAIIEAVGGGGGATGGSAGGNFASGGGAGAYVRALVSAADVGASQAVTVGAAGTSGTGTGSAGNGGNTSVGTIAVAGGGSAGATSLTSVFVVGGAGGTATTPAIGVGINGQQGAGGVSPLSGYGGSGPFGFGGYGVGSSFGGVNGSGFGSGGSGANSNTNGGQGAPGLVLITEFI